MNKLNLVYKLHNTASPQKCKFFFFFFFSPIGSLRTSQVALVVKNSPANAGDIRDVSLIPGSERSPGGGHGHTL